MPVSDGHVVGAGARRSVQRDRKSAVLGHDLAGVAVRYDDADLIFCFGRRNPSRRVFL